MKTNNASQAREAFSASLQRTPRRADSCWGWREPRARWETKRQRRKVTLNFCRFGRMQIRVMRQKKKLSVLLRPLRTLRTREGNREFASAGDRRTLNSAGSVASHEDLKAIAVERQLGPTRGLAVSVWSHFDAIKVVSRRFQDDNGEPFLPEHASQPKRITLTRRSCYLQQGGARWNE